MAVFISYTHADADFAETLAAHLVAERANVWIDRWELQVGDSLRRRIEEAIEQAAAIVVIVSPAALASEWFQRELSAGLVRELEERRVMVLPVLAADCEMPLFLRDKLYADFRRDFDRGLRQVREALARVTSDTLGRVNEADGHIDWSTNWAVDTDDGSVMMFVTILQQSEANPYSVLSRVQVELNDVASRRHIELTAAGAEPIARQLMLEVLADWPALRELRVLLEDAEPVIRELSVEDSGAGLRFDLTAGCQRMGEDTGRDILVPLGRVISELANQTRDRMPPIEREARAEVLRILKHYRPTLV